MHAPKREQGPGQPEGQDDADVTPRADRSGDGKSRLAGALLMVGFGVTGLAGVGAVLGVAAVVCCACCVSGSLIQDLKVGQILGGTPWKMEVAEIVATIVTSFVLVFPIVILHEGNIRQGGIGIGDPALAKRLRSTRSLERMRAGQVRCQFERLGAPASLSFGVSPP